jgi:hypothetical protein
VTRCVRGLVILMMALVLAPAGVAWGQDGSDSPDGLIQYEASTCSYGLGKGPDIPGPLHPDPIAYKTTDTGVNIYFDEYFPKAAADSHPALVVVHGGGWKKGGRVCVNQEAFDAARQGFIVFAIDYRLSCDPTVNPDPYCGTYANTPVGDVKDAIKYAREHGGDFSQSFNGLVGALGCSAGGNLAYMAAATGTGHSKPAVVAGWSGPAELGYFKDTRTNACTGTTSGTGCYNAVKQYVNGLGRQCELGSSSACDFQYTNASPASRYTSSGPPVFIANAIAEKIPKQQAVDFETILKGLGFTALDTYTLCEVSGDGAAKHATGLRGFPCDPLSDGTPVPGASVWESTMLFFQKFVCKTWVIGPISLGTSLCTSLTGQ